MAGKPKPVPVPAHLKRKERLQRVQTALQTLSSVDILVGFPAETKTRQAEDGVFPSGLIKLGKAVKLTNAALAYIHDNGAPEQNIPARPFMRPAISEAAPALGREMLAAAKAVVNQPNTNVIARLHRIGFVAELAIKRKINEGIPPPLSEVTLRKRAAKGRADAKRELARRALGQPASTTDAKTLIDTAQMRNAVKYVLRKKDTQDA